MNIPNWENDINELVNDRGNKRRTITDEEYKTIHHARNRERPLGWIPIKKYIDEHFGIIDVKVIQREYEGRLKQKEEE